MLYSGWSAARPWPGAALITAFRSLACVAACSLAACSGDHSDVVSAGPVQAEPIQSGPEPLYVVSTTVSAGGVDQGYLVPVRSIEAGATFDLEQAMEISDSTIAAQTGSPFLYVGSSAEPSITRWSLQQDGSLLRERTLSLSNFGLNRALVGSELFHSSEKAYLPDDANQQLIVWNPAAMEVIGSIPLGTDREGALQPSMSVTVRSDRVIVVVSWQGDFDDDWSVFGRRTRVISIDPNTDRVVGASDEERCNYLFWGSTSSDGTAYFSPLSYYSPIRSMLGGDRGVDSCGLRIVPPGVSFEAGYEVDLSSLVGGRPAGNLFIVDDSVAFLRVWHSELVPPVLADKSNWQDVINESGFLWWRWRIGSPTAEQIQGQEPGASETPGLYVVDGRKFLPRVAADYSSTTLDELEASGALRPTLTGPGNIWGIVRMR